MRTMLGLWEIIFSSCLYVAFSFFNIFIYISRITRIIQLVPQFTWMLLSMLFVSEVDATRLLICYYFLYFCRHNESVGVVNDVESGSTIGTDDCFQDVFPLQIRLSLSRETCSLIVRISRKVSLSWLVGQLVDLLAQLWLEIQFFD